MLIQHKYTEGAVHSVWSHLDEGSVPYLGVQCFDVGGQVHVQQQVVLDKTPQT